MEGFNILKIIGILSTLFLSLAGGISPLYLPALKRGKKWVGVANIFAGGVLLSLGLLHILKDAIEKFKTIWPNNDYPFTLVLAVLGFSLILLTDKVFAR